MSLQDSVAPKQNGRFQLIKNGYHGDRFLALIDGVRMSFVAAV